MTDIIRMAREAGFTDASFCRWSAYTDNLERFAALVAAAAASEWERKQAEPVRYWQWACSVCGIGADGGVMGFVCPRGDCPTQVRSGTHERS